MAKLNALPDLESELITLMQNPHYFPQVYIYLEAFPVANPDAFLQPLQTCIELMHADILSGASRF